MSNKAAFMANDERMTAYRYLALKRRLSAMSDKAVTGICGAETLDKNRWYRCKSELGRDAKYSLNPTKYDGLVRLLQRHIRSAK